MQFRGGRSFFARPVGAISIPTGAIQSVASCTKVLHSSEFQFQQVQFRVVLLLLGLVVHRVFQFQQVQFRVPEPAANPRRDRNFNSNRCNSELSAHSGPISLPEFQFQQVQFRVKLIRSRNLSNGFISIPTGAIQSARARRELRDHAAISIPTGAIQRAPSLARKS